MPAGAKASRHPRVVPTRLTLLISIVSFFSVALLFLRPKERVSLRDAAVAKGRTTSTASFWRLVGWPTRADRDADFARGLDAWDAHLSNATPAVLLALAPVGEAVPKRTLVVYAYAHAAWREDNLDYFLRYGLVERTDDGADVDYTIVFNGVDAPMDIFEKLGIAHETVHLKPGHAGEDLDADRGARGGESVRTRVETGPRVLLVVRDNSGYDMCASKIVLERGLAPRPGSYTHVILMNGSVRGPFMPSYVSSSWIDAFQQFLVGGVKLVGTTINCLSSKRDGAAGFSSLHVQSMVLATDAEGARAMQPVLQCYDERNEAVSHGEIGATQALLRAGFGVAALQHSWRGSPIFLRDLAAPEVAKRCALVSESMGGDPSWPGVYLGSEPHALELIFIKTNRELDARWIEGVRRFWRAVEVRRGLGSLGPRD
jgi:hypothetical protein